MTKPMRTISINASRPAKVFQLIENKRSDQILCQQTPCTIEVPDNEDIDIELHRSGYSPQIVRIDRSVADIDVQLSRKKIKSKTLNGPDKKPITPDIFK